MSWPESKNVVAILLWPEQQVFLEMPGTNKFQKKTSMNLETQHHPGGSLRVLTICHYIESPFPD